jgi:hypothetical protein
VNPVSSVIENVWHFILDGTGTCLLADLADAVETVMDDIYAEFDGYVSGGTTFQSGLISLLIWAVDEWLTVGSIPNAFALPSFTPSVTEHPLPPSNAPYLRFLTDIPKRTGAKFFPFVDEETNDDATHLVAGAIAALLASGVAYYDAAEAIANSQLTLLPVILSPTENVYTFPTAAVAYSTQRVQRRRQLLRGE